MTEIERDYKASVEDAAGMNQTKSILVENVAQLILGGHNHMYKKKDIKGKMHVVEGPKFVDDETLNYCKIKVSTEEHNFSITQDCVK